MSSRECGFCVAPARTFRSGPTYATLELRTHNVRRSGCGSHQRLRVSATGKSGQGQRDDRHTLQLRSPSWPSTTRHLSWPSIQSDRQSSTSLEGNFLLPFSEHSQTVATRHESSSKALIFLRSRAMFAVILLCQNSGRVAGQRKSGQSCPCQKQPFTKIRARYFGSTMSGVPASFLE